MYGSRREFEGRITGFTMGTGQTLSLLPPQNATGNFVKIVQRLPVRIELADYDPDKAPLFAGLSVAPYVYYKEPATGPNAGAVLQPRRPLRRAPSCPPPGEPRNRRPPSPTAWRASVTTKDQDRSRRRSILHLDRLEGGPVERRGP